MNIKNLKLKGAVLIEPEIFLDERGCFIETYNKKEFSKIVGKEISFVQDNYSESKKMYFEECIFKQMLKLKEN